MIVRRLILLTWVLMISSTQLVGSQNFAENQEEIKPSFPKLILDSVSNFRRSNQDSWSKIKAVLNAFQLKFTPPNLDFRGTGDGANDKGGAEGVGGKVMGAVGKSFSAGRATVEGSAKSAAQGVEKAVQKTAEMVKDSVSDDEGGQARPKTEL
ncbi:hypothetical protein MLD38_028447 [Melastoma candidum]|uniref:Uncharacterized protein n=1 Tax=Melastoma candidum TaxID=119954 RepID=A0ACB9N396_9MYRT|nr:hypothetical protein MLD38_028447 [Melastoma candidum]